MKFVPPRAAEYASEFSEDRKPQGAVTPEILTTISDRICVAASHRDDVSLVRATRQYLLALLDHLSPWPLPASTARDPDALMVELLHDLLRVSRHLALAVARDGPTVPWLARRLATLTDLYRVRTCSVHPTGGCLLTCLACSQSGPQRRGNRRRRDGPRP